MKNYRGQTKTAVKVEKLVLTALVMGLVFLMTSIVKIPTSIGGYIHLGDAMVFMSVILLGKNAAIPASGIGAAMADAAGGYWIYVPATLIIKAAMAFVFAKMLERAEAHDVKGGIRTFYQMTGMLAGGVINVAGYFVFSAAVYGNPVASLGEVPFNILQTGVGIALAFALQKMLEKSGIINRMRASAGSERLDASNYKA